MGVWVATTFGIRASFIATMLIFLVSVMLASNYLPKIDHERMKMVDA
jgi:hypothetical protein